MRYTRLCLAQPGATLALVAVVTAVSLVGLGRLQSEIGYRSFLGSKHPSVRRFDRFLADYGSGLPLAAVWDCKQTKLCESVFDPAALEMAYAVAGKMVSVAGVRSVESPATSPLLTGDVFGPELRHLVEFGEVAADHVSLGRRARTDPLWKGTLISGDGTVGAIVVDVASSDGATSLRVFSRLRDALRPYESHGVRFAFVGGPVEFVVAGTQLRADSHRLIPLMIVLIGGCVWLVFRSLLLTVASLTTVGLAVLWPMGLLGWLGWPQTSVTEVLPPLILAVGICDVIHLLSHYFAACREIKPVDRSERAQAILSALDEVALPCLMTSLTTAAGLASFLSSDLEAFVRFGLIGSLAVLAALLLTFTLLPVLMLVLPLPTAERRHPDRSWQRVLAGIDAFTAKRKGAIVVVTVMVAAASSVGVTRLRIDSSFATLYGETSAVVRWADFVASKLRRPDSLELDLVAPEGESVLSTDNLLQIEKVGERLSAIDGLGHARSVAVVLEHADHVLEKPEHSFSTIADYRRLAPHSFARWVRDDGRAARISVDADKSAQRILRSILVQARSVLAQLPSRWSWSMTGPMAVVGRMLDDIRSTQVRSFGLAFILIFGLLLIDLGSPTLALAGMVPTTLPALMVLGVMGFAGIGLDVGGAMVAAVVMGVAVDDTIHLLAEHRRLQHRGFPRHEALSEATRSVGRAIITTSGALALGFLSLTISSWQSVSRFGLISAIAIICALAVTLLVLPALLYVGGQSMRGDDGGRRA